MDGPYSRSNGGANIVTLEDLEDKFELIELRGKDTVQSAHCALQIQEICF